MRKAGVLSLLILACVFALHMTSSASGQEGKKSKEGADFSIAKIVVAEDVRDREPVGVAEVFPSSTEKVYCFIEATDIRENTEVTFIWYHEGKKLHTYSLPLMEGPRWRTFSYKNLHGMTGPWKVEIRDSAGNSIESISFKVA